LPLKQRQNLGDKIDNGATVTNFGVPSLSSFNQTAKVKTCPSDLAGSGGEEVEEGGLRLNPLAGFEVTTKKR